MAKLSLKSFKRIFRNSQGVSMIFPLVAAAGFSLLLYTSSSLQNNREKDMLRSRAIQSRNSLRELVNAYIKDPALITPSFSYTGPNQNANLMLKYCLEGTPTLAPLPVCAPNCCNSNSNPQPFMLVDPADIQKNKILAGTDAVSSPLIPTTADPARFDFFGQYCTAVDNNCAYEIVVAYVATCPTNTAVCAKAEKVVFTAGIRQGTMTNGNPATLPAGVRISTISLSSDSDSTSMGEPKFIPGNTTTNWFVVNANSDFMVTADQMRTFFLVKGKTTAVTLPYASGIPSGSMVAIKNADQGVITVRGTASEKIAYSSKILVEPAQIILFANDDSEGWIIIDQTPTEGIVSY